jgi:serine O-acetyltransferase
MFARLAEDIRSVRERDPAARSLLEVLTCYPGLHAVWGHRVSHWLWTHGLKWLARLNSHIARWLTLIEIHPGATLGRRVFIDHGIGVIIGETAEVGDDCTIYQGVTLGGTSLTRGAKRHPTLGRDVVVGAGAKVLGPFTVGDGARIGSNAVVVREVPPGATAVGIPARIISEQGEMQSQTPHGFEAYGITGDMPDPVANAIRALLGHVQALQAEVQSLKAGPDTFIEPLGAKKIELPEECGDFNHRSG